MKIQNNKIELGNSTYINDRYVLPDMYNNVVYQNTTLISPFFYILGYDFDVPLPEYELYTYNILKTVQHFFSKSSNVIELGSDYGYTAKRYSDYVYNYYVFDKDKVVRDLSKHNTKSIVNIHVFDLIESRQLQQIDSEFMIVRDNNLLTQYIDTVMDKCPTLLIKNTVDTNLFLPYGYELYKCANYILCVPFYCNKEINLPKYAQ